MRNSRLPRRIEKGPAPSDSRYGSHAGLFVIVASPPNSVSTAGARPSMGCTAATLRVGVAWRRGVLLGRPRARAPREPPAALRSDRPAAAPPGGSRRFLFGALAASPRPAFSVYLGRYALASRRRLSDVTYTPRALLYPPRGRAASRLTPRARRGLALWRGQSIRHIRGIPACGAGAPRRPGAIKYFVQTRTLPNDLHIKHDIKHDTPKRYFVRPRACVC